MKLISLLAAMILLISRAPATGRPQTWRSSREWKEKRGKNVISCHEVKMVYVTPKVIY
jgi:hypothetical protein